MQAKNELEITRKR